jgi:hypothetical protein
MVAPLFPVLKKKLPIDREVLGSFTMQAAIAGQRMLLPLWSYPRYRYTLSFEVLRSYAAYSEWQTLEGFYTQMITSPGVFQYNDADDGSATSMQFATGDGSTTAFQLTRSLGGMVCPVFCPTGTPEIYDNGSLLASGYTIDSYGVVNFTTAPASGHVLTWTGTFNWYCRFENQSQKFSKIASGFRTLDGLVFSTEKF